MMNRWNLPPATVIIPMPHIDTDMKSSPAIRRMWISNSVAVKQSATQAE